VVWKIWIIFPYIGNDHPKRLSYFSEGGLNHQPDFRSKTLGLKKEFAGSKLKAATRWWFCSCETSMEAFSGLDLGSIGTPIT
jgi:hypothetical protein